MAEALPFSEVRTRLSELSDRVERQHERIVLTRHGRPSLVLMNFDELESLEETLDILDDDELMASLRLSQREAAEGKLISLREVVQCAPQQALGPEPVGEDDHVVDRAQLRRERCDSVIQAGDTDRRGD